MTFTCTKCGIEKSTKDFYPNKTKRGHKTRCRVCVDAHNKQWAKDNLEKIRAASRNRYRKNRDKYRRKAAKMHAQNPNGAKARRHRRRASQKIVVPQRWIKSQCQENACYWCGKPLSTDAHVDHIMPLALHGWSHESNLVLTCPTCNLRKKNKHPLVWIAELLMVQST